VDTCGEHLPIDENTYEREFRTKTEYLVRIAREELAAQLMRELSLRALESKHSAEIARGAIDAYAEVIEPYRRPIIQRFVRYIRFHPLQFAGATSLAAALFVLAVLNLQTVVKDKNPAYTRAREEFLVVYNKEGQELWRKHIGVHYDQNYLSSRLQRDPENYLATADVDGDRRNEVIAVFGFLGTADRRSIFCYDHDGATRSAVV
jgi:hypothetical protein